MPRHSSRRTSRPARAPRRRRTTAGAKVRASLIGALAGISASLGLLAASPDSSSAQASVDDDRPLSANSHAARQFTFCHSGGGTNCVVDGDTVWIDGEKIRIADIDAPETHPPRCAKEAAKGDAATRRLHALLNDGAFELISDGRDRDRYGRALRIIVRNGHSLGDQLVADGLARRWTGRREPWC